MTRFGELLSVLSRAGVDYIVVGGVAATAHGSARATFDLDVVYRRTDDNLERLVQALNPLHPYLRGAPTGLPFRWDAKTLKNGLNFTLTTALGDLDVLGEISGCGGYEQIFTASIRAEFQDVECRFIGLEDLIRAKRAAGRPKDFEAIAELEIIRDERKQF